MSCGNRFVVWEKTTRTFYCIPRHTQRFRSPFTAREKSTTSTAIGLNRRSGDLAQATITATTKDQQSNVEAEVESWSPLNDATRAWEGTKPSLPSKDSSTRILSKRGIDESASQAFLLSAEHSQSLATDSPRLIVRTVIKNRRRKDVRAGWKHQVRAEFHKYQEETRDRPLPIFHTILEELDAKTITDRSWLEQVFRVLVPQHVAMQAVCGVDNTLWEIASNNGCSAEADSAGLTGLGDQGYFVSGPVKWLKKTLVEIRRAYPDIVVELSSQRSQPASKKRIVSTPSIRIKQLQVRMRNVMSYSRRVSITEVRLDKLPKPEHWTARSFADHVDFVTSARPSISLTKSLTRGYQHQVAVIVHLHDLFADPESKPYISRKAFNTALQYMVKTSQTRDARVLFARMQACGLRMSTETFNIMLRQAAKQEDCLNFMRIFHLMLMRGILPNGDTWVALLMAAYQPHLVLAVTTKMMEKGLLQNVSTLRAVVERLIGYEITSSLDGMQSQENFVSQMDSRYGPKWLSTNSANKVLDALGIRGLISRCRQFLHFMASRFVEPDTCSFNIVLKHIKGMRNPKGAVEFLCGLSASFEFAPDKITFQTLFELAWNTGSWNVARVVWKSACLSASTTRRMRMLLEASLKAETRAVDRRIAAHLCHTDEALFVTAPIEAYQSAEVLSVYQNALESIVLDKDPVITAGGIASPSHQYRRKQVGRLLHCELKTVETLIPLAPFESRLAEAIKQDQIWRSALPSTYRQENLYSRLRQRHIARHVTDCAP